MFIGLLGVYIYLQEYKYSCGYNMHYDSEMNRCNVVWEQCSGHKCEGPATVILCGQSKRICGVDLSCSCSDGDNTGWIQVK